MDSAIKAAGGDTSAIRGPGEGKNAILAAMGIDVIAGGSLPYLDGVVAEVAARGDVLAVRGPCDAAHKAGMTTIGEEGYLFLSVVFRAGCVYIPDMHDTGGISRGNKPAIW